MLSALLRKSLYFLTLVLATIFVIQFLPAFAQQTPKFSDFYPPTAIPTITQKTTLAASKTPAITPTGGMIPTQTSSLPGSPVPSGNISPTPKPAKKTPTPKSTKSAEKKFFHFSQRDPRWKDYNPDTTGHLGPCGCGETSVAMNLAFYLDTSKDPSEGKYNPRPIWDEFEKLYPGRCGTALSFQATVLGNHGLKAKVQYYESSNPSSSNNVLNNYLESGYTIILHYKRTWTTVGHYVVLSKIQGDKIYVYDPYDLPGSAEPRLIEDGAIIDSYVTIKS